MGDTVRTSHWRTFKVMLRDSSFGSLDRDPEINKDYFELVIHNQTDFLLLLLWLKACEFYALYLCYVLNSLILY